MEKSTPRKFNRDITASATKNISGFWACTVHKCSNLEVPRVCCQKLPCRLNLVVLVLLSAAIPQDTLPWLHEPLFQAFVALVAFVASAAATVAGSSLELALRSHLRLHLHAGLTCIRGLTGT